MYVLNFHVYNKFNYKQFKYYLISITQECILYIKSTEKNISSKKPNLLLWRENNLIFRIKVLLYKTTRTFMCDTLPCSLGRFPTARKY